VTEKKNIFIGVLAIILGLIVIIFPLISVYAFSVLAGIGIIVLAIWLFIQSYRIWGKNLAAGIADLILAFIALAFGIVFLGNVKGLEFLTFLAMYIIAIFIVITGITYLFSGEGIKNKAIGVLGIIFGVLYFIIGIYVGNPIFLAVILGAFLIMAGIMEIFDLFGEINLPKQDE
jgi:membrane protein HdeD